MSNLPFVPDLHPMINDPIESGRCPDCGTPGVEIGRDPQHITLACPVCAPEFVARAQLEADTP